jgi:hypothetical protein
MPLRLRRCALCSWRLSALRRTCRGVSVFFCYPMIARSFAFYLVFAVAVLAAACGGKPTTNDPRLKAKLALRLADGSPISQDGSDEYNPHLLKLPNNYLALVFGSNRGCAASCADHNLFIASSLTPFNGDTLPFFSTPVPVTRSRAPPGLTTRHLLISRQRSRAAAWLSMPTWRAPVTNYNT